MKQPVVIVCAGGGGVGKTTASAAFALALAKGGYRALIVSIDPARRLADAMGVELGTQARQPDSRQHRGGGKGRCADGCHLRVVYFTVRLRKRRNKF